MEGTNGSPPCDQGRLSILYAVMDRDAAHPTIAGVQPMATLYQEIASLRTPTINCFWQPEFETHISGEGNERRNPPANEAAPFAFTRLGCNGWNCIQGTAEYTVFESDWLDPNADVEHGSNPQTEEQLLENDRRLHGKAHINRSTGGKGRHYRVEVQHPDGSKVRCSDRHTYNALCRYVCDQLGMTDKTCAKGGYLWVWSANHNGQSFESLGEQTEPFIVPLDWELPTRTCKVRNRDIALTGRHEQILSAIEEAGFPAIPKAFDDGTEYFATHTCGLKAAHTTLKLRGWFDTVSPGKDSATPNCYIIPFPEGFQVFRYGTVDEPNWNKRQSDNKSWTWFDQFEESDWRSLCVRFQGSPKKGRSKHTFNFHDPDQATAAISAAGGDIEPPWGPVLVELADGFISCFIEAKGDLPGWTKDGKHLAKTCTIQNTDCRAVIMPEDARVAFFWNEEGQQNGETLYLVRLSPDEEGNEVWKPESITNWRAALKARGYTDAMIEEAYNQGCSDPMRIVSRPFEKTINPLYWNRGVQFSCDPVPGEHPHWDLVFNHTGSYLDSYVAEHPWCQENGIRTGGDYLRCYMALTVQRPATRVPQLFLYSRTQGTGKDTFPDSCKLLFSRGAVVDANTAATSDAGFSFELIGAVMYVLNELDLSRSGSKAESRVRKWTTGHTINIHEKGRTPFETRNYARVIQMANDLSYKMVDADDERVVIIELPKIKSRIDWARKLEPALKRERAAFLHTLLNYYLPEQSAPNSRCFLPILMTDAKQQAITLSLPTLSADDELLLNNVMKAHEEGWTELCEFDELPEVVQTRYKPNTFQAAWNRISKHLSALGLFPIDREAIKRHQKAAWGFQNTGTR